MDRKRTISFKICLPCRPLAEWQASLTPSARRTPPEARHEARRRRSAPPLPLAGEGWGGGSLGVRTRGESPHPPRVARHPPPQAGERLSEVSSCIGVLGTRIACFCVEADEQFVGESDPDDPFFFFCGET